MTAFKIKFKKYLLVSVLLSAMLLTLAVSVNASPPYNSYSNTELKSDAASPVAYLPDDVAINFGEAKAKLNQPKDMYIRDKLIYVLDAGNKRVVVYDSDLKLVRTIDEIKTNEGEVLNIEKAQGIFVDTKKNIYITDPQNARVLKTDENGSVILTIVRPDNAEYTTEFFHPQKVLVSPDDTIYVLAESVYQGALVYDQEGNFLSFYGSAKVQPSIKLIIDQTWKGILSKEARSKMAQYVPVEYTNFDIDSEGFVYTCSSFVNKQIEQIRKLNYNGNNVFPYQDNFGEKDIVGYKTNTYVTSFIDVCISEHDLIYSIDNTRGRVYTFDQEGNRLFTFSNISEQKGGVKSPAAIDTIGNVVYLLDFEKGSITRFSPTEYGTLIMDAVSMYSQGKYENARGEWQKVISMNGNFEYAYIGMGQAALKSGDYKQAVSYFRSGKDRVNESKAFSSYRNQILRQNSILVVALLFLLFILVTIFSSKALSTKIKAKVSGRSVKDESTKFTTRHTIMSIIRHPFDGYSELKYARYKNWPAVAAIVTLLFLSSVLSRQYSGFRFNTYLKDDLNIFVEIAISFGAFALFCISNWAICTLLSGEGRFNEICTFFAYALIPFIATRLLSIPLSLVLTLDESVFLTWFQWIGIIWTVFLVFQALRIVHQYSGAKTVAASLLTIVGVCIVLIIILLLVALFQQVYSFLSSVINELWIRG